MLVKSPLFYSALYNRNIVSKRLHNNKQESNRINDANSNTSEVLDPKPKNIQAGCY